ncbi:CDP-archaeol synthase [Chryseobacterium sp. SNU WT5]|uniref:phosphatidate cytidylyltransferase n=1 Tax=Chryseobacterium sp. SNU WT5 TaxID=2594269 RepID=UPI001180879C|nr:CDP-archaeol synthase [Chryseobacterium sp. SNU WT5]QDP84934.1 CDP-archaeol synthase [Chryseobacterium sp. SNU WT5]
MKLENNISDNKFADVPLRIKTWMFIILAFALGISHPIAMKIFVSWIGFQVFFEFLRMFKIQRYKVVVSVILAIVQFLLLYLFNFENYLLYAMSFALAVVLFFLSIKVSAKQMTGISIGLVIALFIFPHLALVRETVFGVKALIFLVVITEVNDVFQYLMGKFFGKHKITPKISPNKTWEGFVGGVLLTMLLSTILGYFLLPSHILINIILGLILGISGFFGDVLMSFLKRKTNIKDTGNLLPGHGGLLDRMDSLIFNAPIFFWILPLLLNN